MEEVVTKVLFYFFFQKLFKKKLGDVVNIGLISRKPMYYDYLRAIITEKVIFFVGIYI